MDESWVLTALPWVNMLRAYHRHQVVGLEHLPRRGGALLVVNHSLATYDITLLWAAIYEETGRLPQGLADRLFFKFPGLGDLLAKFGSVQGSPENARTMLERGALVCVAPGGMREALRPTSERYQVRWERRKGFVRVAMEAQVPIILAACPKADDMYDVYANPVTPWFYKKFRIPVFIARGLGLSPIPKPVRLVHHIAPPMHPPPLPKDPKALKAAVDAFHAQVVAAMEQLMAQAVIRRLPS